jgi:nucleoside-diphosphate-sugar epimerase
MADTVLVTGATGFIAKHVIANLLRAGYAVRGTVRALDKGPEQVARAVTRGGADPAALSFVAADLTSDAGWDEACRGVRFVQHIASPFPIEQPREREAVVAPARDGTLRVLGAAARNGVERVVMTSSTVAVMYTRQHAPGYLYTEADWSDETRADITPYIASKTIAEKAAWEFVRSRGGGLELVAINPGFVQGPALDPDLSTSLAVLHLMGRGAYPGAPKVEFPIADVRDVAELHVAAMTHPAAAGERFLACNGSASLMGLGRLMVEALPDLKGKAPKFELPDLVVRSLALVDRRLAAVLPELGSIRVCSNAKAERVFGHTFRPAATAVRDAALSLRDLHVI